ncbi:MAG: right-handed parallel beta-helix repeat-containing protein [Thermoleophilaceae bacterium]
MTPTRFIAKLVPVLVLAALALPGSAFGQASRTWVSGVGDDANPCSRTAPCKTFAGAISKTGNGGEINCLDPGGFGGVTITKSLTIKCHYTEGGVLVSGTNAIVVNATATDKVTLRGLDINGIGVGAQTSLVGVKVLSAKTVQVFDSEIYRFQAGIDVNPSANSVRVLVKNTHIHDNGVGVINAPGSNSVGFATTTLRHNDITDNTCGAATGAFGTNASTPQAATDCGTATAASGVSKVATIDAVHNGFNDNGTGVFARGTLGIFEIAYNDITGNSAFGIHRIESSTVRGTTPGTNFVSNNAANDGTNASSTLAKRAAKRR